MDELDDVDEIESYKKIIDDMEEPEESEELEEPEEMEPIEDSEEIEVKSNPSGLTNNLMWFGIGAAAIMLLSSFFKKNGVAKAQGFSESMADPIELAEGIRVELEHTSDPVLAKAIALDHLAEDPKYYTKLKAMGL